MRIAIGSDHRGVDAARSIRPHIEALGHTVALLGECSGNPCDYPDNAWLVGRAVASGEVDRGILICGSGIGMSIAANKIPGVRAALVTDELTAQLSRAHNNANVLCLAADLLGQNLLHRIIDTWLSTPFDGGRHERRIQKIHAIERGENPTLLKPDAVSA
ncbi:MAG: ribose 5-phosphate isomerase B [Phycisphaeraceae bacterium]|nr:ribose 5-phosphate isomerase B [Phycisphaerales bacterium]QOJ17178.1 MAG: ribose 5-phosphate isomerase B [Phycisphaeraceae bacterium]